MSEYIERESALELLKLIEYKESSINFAGAMIRALRDMPTADVVPVVWCKECKFWDRNRISCEGLARCQTGENGIRYRNSKDFCSRGARMDGDGE